VKIAGVELPSMLVEALRDCRRHFYAAAIFSLLINLLYLAPTLYMLQVYDRVVPTAGKTTLLFVTLALALALLTLAVLDMIRNRLLVRASQRLDALIAPRILTQMMATDSAVAGQAMRDFDSVRTAMASPAIAAIFDVPWTPVFLAVAFLLHFWIGIMAIVAAGILVTLAWLNQKATQRHMEIATSAMASAHNSQQAAAVHGTTIKGLGMTAAMVERQLGHRRIALANMVHAQISGSRLTATSRFFRLFVQSSALGLGALLAIAGEISAGAIIASSVLLSRALQPIESIIGA
jgi:ATP-binding cassette subfamily C protein